MTAVTRNKLCYVIAILALLAIVFGIWILLGRQAWVLFVIACLLLIPGRVSAVVLRDLYRSRRLVDLERYEDAIESGERFLEALEAQPWRRFGLLLTWSIYTWNAEAMARNNQAAARIGLGDLDGAEVQLKQALSLDPDYPIPYHNLAIVQAVRGAEAESKRLLSIAAAKGFGQTLDDRVVASVSKAYAALQSAALR